MNFAIMEYLNSYPQVKACNDVEYMIVNCVFGYEVMLGLGVRMSQI